LLLNGSGSWGAGGLRLRGEATAAEVDQPALANLLNIIGRRDGARSLISIG
jgi:general secretion pathway protein N